MRDSGKVLDDKEMPYLVQARLEATLCPASTIIRNHSRGDSFDRLPYFLMAYKEKLAELPRSERDIVEKAIPVICAFQDSVLVRMYDLMCGVSTAWNGECVYLALTCEPFVYKIGFSANIERRLASFGQKVYNAFVIKSHQGRSAETWLHKVLERYRVIESKQSARLREQFKNGGATELFFLPGCLIKKIEPFSWIDTADWCAQYGKYPDTLVYDPADFTRGTSFYLQ